MCSEWVQRVRERVEEERATRVCVYVSVLYVCVLYVCLCVFVHSVCLCLFTPQNPEGYLLLLHKHTPTGQKKNITAQPLSMLPLPQKKQPKRQKKKKT
jgi:hypothetical protein